MNFTFNENSQVRKTSIDEKLTLHQLYATLNQNKVIIFFNY